MLKYTYLFSTSLLCCVLFGPISKAQMLPGDMGVALRMSSVSYLGLAADYTLNPRLALTTAIGYRSRQTQLAFGEPGTERFSIPDEFIDYDNQQHAHLQVGLRYYVDPDPRAKLFVESYIGYTARSRYSDDFFTALERDDLFPRFNPVTRRNVEDKQKNYGVIGALVGYRIPCLRVLYIEPALGVVRSTLVESDVVHEGLSASLSAGYLFIKS